MTCQRMPNADKNLPDGFICGFSPIYEFDGYLFEAHPYHGPIPLRKYLEPCANTPRGFWDMWDVFYALPEAAKRALLFKEQ